MSANITDKFTETFNGQNPSSTTVANPRSIGGTSLICNSLAGWPTNTAVHFATYKKDAIGAKIAGSQTDWKGIVSGSSINTLTRQGAAADAGNGVGDIVEMMPTYAWAQDLAVGLEASHNNDGTPKSGITYPASTFTSPTLNTPTVASPTFSGTPATGTLSTIALTNPYKFSVYRNAAWTTGGGVNVPVPFDTKTGTGYFDTGNNVDITTNKGRFTAPIAGFYYFSGGAGCSIAGGTGYGCALLVNGVQVGVGTLAIQGDTAGFGAYAVASGLLKLAANDYVEFGFYGSSAAGATGPQSNGFSGFLVDAT